MNPPAQENSLTNYCQWCYQVGQSRCARCQSAYYCCRDHQIQHWDIHRKVCVDSAASSNLQLQDFSCFDPIFSNDMFDSPSQTTSAENVDFPIPTDEEIASSLNSVFQNPTNPMWDTIDICDTQDLASAFDQFLNPHDAQFDQLFSPDPKPDFNLFDLEENSETFNNICTNVIHDLNTYGICVIDKFIGELAGSVIVEEVKDLYVSGVFRKGELVSTLVSKEKIRNDVTTWVNGTEIGCEYVGRLIKKLDTVIATCNKMKRNGILAKYKLHRRTKAMIACYPGDGTYYKKHIDNPNGDGRCITCIYYLNKNWDTKIHGGLLRMFPSNQNTQVANIEPIFDRMIFFWSDRRNPHEVLPAYATRFAITVWYFDADERDRAVLK